MRAVWENRRSQRNRQNFLISRKRPKSCLFKISFSLRSQKCHTISLVIYFSISLSNFWILFSSLPKRGLYWIEPLSVARNSGEMARDKQNEERKKEKRGAKERKRYSNKFPSKFDVRVLWEERYSGTNSTNLSEFRKTCEILEKMNKLDKGLKMIV